SGLSTGFLKAGRLQPLAGEREVVMARARAKGAAEFWGSKASWNVIEAQDAGDWRAPSDTGLYIHDTLSAILHPRRACESLAAAIRAKGGEIVAEGPDEGLVVWATGWKGLENLSDALATAVGSGVKGQAALLQYDACGHPQIFAAGLHIVPHLDGTVAIGSTSEREFTESNTTDHLLDDIIQRAKDLMPVLQDAQVVTRWAGVRPRAKSRAPLLGEWPDRRDHFIANGGFKIGFGVAPMIAKTMCELMLDGKDTIPEGFRLTV
ncbi:MAG: FAD-binding oxidoreductase, partial [Octadecabacter sp.]|nr:FAD-binding oxidoreductase [Octadecabacter sp.]